MSEVMRKEVKTYKVTMPCPNCKEGNMYYNGYSLSCNPPINGHTCDKCHHQEGYKGVCYPSIEYGD